MAIPAPCAEQHAASADLLIVHPLKSLPPLASSQSNDNLLALIARNSSAHLPPPTTSPDSGTKIYLTLCFIRASSCAHYTSPTKLQQSPWSSLAPPPCIRILSHFGSLAQLKKVSTYLCLSKLIPPLASFIFIPLTCLLGKHSLQPALAVRLSYTVFTTFKS